MKRTRIEKLVKDASLEKAMGDTPAAEKLRSSNLSIRTLENAPNTQDFRDGKRHLHLAAKRGKTFHDCASMHPDYLCCNVKVVASVSNCPYECSYCFLQNYLTDTTLSVVGDVDALVREIDEKCAEEPGRFFRVGNWELGDSLALEPLTGSAAELVRAFAERPNLVLELRTKSAEVAGLLTVAHAGHTVVSWTVNPDEVVRREEYRTASIAARIAAMEKVLAAGYPIALHFDPMIHTPNWREAYAELIDQIFSAVPPERVAWISIGSLRFNPEMKRKMQDNYPGSHATRAEMLLGDDGKVRYLKLLRIDMYRHLLALLRNRGIGDVFVYLCMERPDMWERVLGFRPTSTGHVDYLLTQSLHRRFPALVTHEPMRALYDSAGDA